MIPIMPQSGQSALERLKFYFSAADVPSTYFKMCPYANNTVFNFAFDNFPVDQYFTKRYIGTALRESLCFPHHVIKMTRSTCET